ncbi:MULTISPECIES: glycine cleavage system protein GcvH [Corynebacterium]|uniref:Glycine cleavage system H protein n=2 Tax=Corynebacterium glucuronolyticum TaxID=39791 RepID=A0A7T4BNC5_9CORY|nr:MULTISPECIES: glycine cleavage system protein GcvH [Corynebacterium]EEI26874.1 glycine cleavage system H protein [Corynebacterium glucuronolyticum ATCC 51867]EEI62050.1 glycine cleavage system H protein [Corynebacterium glucuronolyticum ATCC 51866]MCT1441272.1 glycine cleavage system protein GcvH [Corynebacterium glucuronolyticum]MCT1562318.1 glycine cleavage system protein GcvH [Corynebacterium glucuronolyticum]OFO42391.1 glycine cleavage system protein H [Corynebacterium sp. HMSC073D01]
MANLPENYSYSAEHEWIDVPAAEAEGKTVKVGVTEIATDALGEIVYVDLPSVGDEVTHSEPCGEVESTKSVSDIFSPVSGTITAVNEALEDDPALINNDPYGEGWIYEVQVSEVGPVKDKAGYEADNA